MLSKSQSKHIRSLHSKKYRQKYGQFIVEGNKLAKELMDSSLVVEQVIATASWLKSNDNAANATEVTDREMKEVSAMTSPSEVLAVARIPDITAPSLETTSYIALDNIRDPGNLGTILRTADWFGMGVLCSEGCVDVFNPKTVQASMGSVTRIPVWYGNLGETLQTAHVIAADMNGRSVWEEQFPDPCVILIGNEASGIDPELDSIINTRVTIPRIGKAESLNAAMAAAVCCAAFRQ